jgi:hypothetical protein
MDVFDKILDVIGHLAGSDMPLETLTRLYRKNQRDTSLPGLERSNVRCWEEKRAKPWFCGLCNYVETKEAASCDSGHSIVVLVRNGKESILDGHKRCRAVAFGTSVRSKTTTRRLFIEPL